MIAYVRAPVFAAKRGHQMSAYVVALGKVHDQVRFEKYLEAVGPTVEACGGELLGLEDSAEVLEGTAPYPRVVLLKFPSKDDARRWKSSPEYVAIVEHRLASSEHVLYLVDEFAPPAG